MGNQRSPAYVTADQTKVIQLENSKTLLSYDFKDGYATKMNLPYNVSLRQIEMSNKGQYILGLNLDRTALEIISPILLDSGTYGVNLSSSTATRTRF